MAKVLRNEDRSLHQLAAQLSWADSITVIEVVEGKQYLFHYEVHRDGDGVIITNEFCHREMTEHECCGPHFKLSVRDAEERRG